MLCRAFPDATLYTLIHRRGSLSPAIESMKIRTSPLQMDSGRFPLVSPPAADHAAGRQRLASHGRRPGDQPEPLRGQGRRAAAGCRPHLLLLHADAIRLAGPRYLPGKLVRPAGAAAAGPSAALAAQALGSRDGQPRVALRCDLRDGSTADRAVLSARQPGDPAAGRTSSSTPRQSMRRRGTTIIWSSRRSCRTSASTRRSPRARSRAGG